MAYKKGQFWPVINNRNITKNTHEFEIGDICYHRVDYTGKFNSARVIKMTPQFCILETDSGHTYRKSKRLLFDTEDKAKLYMIDIAHNVINDHFDMSILELSKIFTDMLEKYPERFV
jgi:hypothetical protein